MSALIDEWPILRAISGVVEEIGGIEIWCFGSVSRGETPNDIDLLVLYQERHRIERLQFKLEEIKKLSPLVLDVIYMRPSEEQFYGFIKSTDAVRII